jgi:hypothetical protein
VAEGALGDVLGHEEGTGPGVNRWIEEVVYHCCVSGFCWADSISQGSFASDRDARLHPKHEVACLLSYRELLSLSYWASC